MLSRIHTGFYFVCYRPQYRPPAQSQGKGDSKSSRSRAENSVHGHVTACPVVSRRRHYSVVAILFSPGKSWMAQIEAGSANILLECSNKIMRIFLLLFMDLDCKNNVLGVG